MSNGNYIKLNRSMLKWEWYTDTNTKVVFLHAMLKANWDDGGYKGHKLQPGDVVFGRKKWAEELGMSEQQIRTAINHLKETGEISTIKTTNRFTILRIENWALYQSKDDEATNNLTNKQPTSNQQATNKQPRTKKEKKGRREEGKEVCVETHARKTAYGRFDNVLLTPEEYNEITETFTDYTGLVNKVSAYLSKYPNKEYASHAALIWQIGEEDKWQKNRRQTENVISQEEINRMRVEAFGEGWNS